MTFSEKILYFVISVYTYLTRFSRISDFKRFEPKLRKNQSL